MHLIETTLVATITIIVFMTSGWLVSQIVGKLSVIDIFWGLGFIVVAISTLLFNGAYLTRQVLVTTLVILWGARLAFYIYVRNKNKPEDFRYQKMKENWKDSAALQSYFKVFLLQGLFMLIITLVVQVINSDSHQDNLNILDIFGALVWLFGFLFESIGDLQMYLFKNNPKNKGKIMKYGLWQYTRHPNYFGESVQWWAIFLIGLSTANGLLGIISPIVITFMLLKVSGVPMLEAKYKGNKEYINYIRKTSSFIPMPKKA